MVAIFFSREGRHKKNKKRSKLSTFCEAQICGRISPYSVSLRIQNAGKYGPEKLQIRTLFTQGRLQEVLNNFKYNSHIQGKKLELE